jgi:LysM repeat protein
VESLKPILLLVVLGGVAYAVYVALNHAPPTEPPGLVETDWNKPAAAEPSAPSTNRGTEIPISAAAKNSWDAGSASDAPAFKPAQRGSEPAPTDPRVGSAAPPMVQPAAPTNSAPSNSTPSVPNIEQPQPGAPDLGSPNLSTPAAPSGANEQSRRDYEASLRSVQTSLSKGKLVDALHELSKWYDNPAVPPEDQGRVVELLGQLAGTVIYSREPWLAMPYQVRAGDTLETIAQQYQVPWQLLAKINGIDNPNSLIPGEKLKVIKGPFSAQLNPSQQWLALFVDGLYAGRYRVQSDGPLAKPDGTYPVVKFATGQPGVAAAKSPYISLGGDLQLRVPDDAAAPGVSSMQISPQDMSDVFDMLSERSQVTIRR